MKLINKKPKQKQRKASVLHDYKASYLDKRSKSYHHVVMTAFAGMYGLVGFLYVFGSNAATNDSASDVNANQTFLEMYGPMLLAAGVVLFVLVALYIYKLSKSK